MIRNVKGLVRRGFGYSNRAVTSLIKSPLKKIELGSSVDSCSIRKLPRVWSSHMSDKVFGKKTERGSIY